MNPLTRPHRAHSFFTTNSEQPLELESLRQRVPALFQDHAHPDCSERYEFVATDRIVQALQSEGFQLFSVRASGCKQAADQGFVLHTLRLRHPHAQMKVGGLYPEVVLTNSHNRSSTLQIDAGIYRRACDNGLVVDAGAGLSFNIVHKGDQQQAVINAALEVVNYAPRLEQVVASWSERQLREGEVQEFGRRALELRYPEGKVPTLDPALIRRSDDNRNDLWSVYNRVQENLLRGGQTYRKLNAQGRDRPASSRPLGSVRRSLALNQGLWALAAEFLPR